MKISRKDFIRITGLGSAVLSTSYLTTLGSPAQNHIKNTLNLGLASYSFRKFSLEKTIEMVKRLGLQNLALKSMHMPLEASASETKTAAQKVRDAGINLYGAGVIYMKNEDQVHQAFEYAKNAGLSVIIGVPNHGLLPLVNQKVQDTNIKVAIHNHGPGDELYPRPASIMEKIENLDQRIGMCIDIGHTIRIGEDPIKDANRYAKRLYDIHIKDVNMATPEGHTVEIGRGVIDIPGFLKTIHKIKYSGSVSLEFEKDAEDPLPGSAESIGYVKGVLATLN